MKISLFPAGYCATPDCTSPAQDAETCCRKECVSCVGGGFQESSCSTSGRQYVKTPEEGGLCSGESCSVGFDLQHCCGNRKPCAPQPVLEQTYSQSALVEEGGDDISADDDGGDDVEDDGKDDGNAATHHDTAGSASVSLMEVSVNGVVASESSRLKEDDDDDDDAADGDADNGAEDGDAPDAPGIAENAARTAKSAKTRVASSNKKGKNAEKKRSRGSTGPDHRPLSFAGADADDARVGAATGSYFLQAWCGSPASDWRVDAGAMCSKESCTQADKAACCRPAHRCNGAVPNRPGTRTDLRENMETCQRDHVIETMS